MCPTMHGSRHVFVVTADDESGRIITECTRMLRPRVSRKTETSVESLDGLVAENSNEGEVSKICARPRGITTASR
jgi:hypothetical protein